MLTPPSRATMAGKTGGEMTKGELLNSKGLEVTDSTYHVENFVMSVVGKGTPYSELEAKGSELSDAMREAIKGMPIGAKMYFEYIMCVNKEHDTRMSLPISVTIKNATSPQIYPDGRK
jgi:hypothetical protein